MRRSTAGRPWTGDGSGAQEMKEAGGKPRIDGSRGRREAGGAGEDGTVRGVALLVVADGGGWRWVTGAGGGRTGHSGDGLEVEAERREEEAWALMRLGAPDHGFGGSGASPDWDEDGGGERVRGSGTSRDRGEVRGCWRRK